MFWAVLLPHPAPLPTSTCQITETGSAPLGSCFEIKPAMLKDLVYVQGSSSGLLLLPRDSYPPWSLSAAQAFPGLLAGQGAQACSNKIFFGELGRNDSTDQPLLVFVSSHVITLMFGCWQMIYFLYTFIHYQILAR